MLRISNKSDLNKIAMDITNNSELYGDEVVSVIGQLSDILANAEKFGMVYSDIVDNMWGGTVQVVAYPSHRRSEWIF